MPPPASARPVPTRRPGPVPRPRSAARSPPGSDHEGLHRHAHHAHREDLVQRRSDPVGRGEDPSSRSRSTTAWGSSRASAPTRPTTARVSSASPTTCGIAAVGADPDDGPALLGRRDGPGGEGHGAGHRPALLLHPPDRLLRIRRDGPQHPAVRGRRGHRLLAVGRLLGRRRADQGRADEDLVVGPPRPQHHAAGRQDDRQLRQQLAGQGRGAQGRLRRGHPAEPGGFVPSAPARTSSWPARHGKLILAAPVGAPSRASPRTRS